MSIQMSLTVFDASNVAIPPGPVLSVLSFSSRQKLDGFSTYTIETSAAEERAVDFLTVRRGVRVNFEPVNDSEISSSFTDVVILRRKVSDSTTGPRLVLTCTDKASFLKDATTLFGRKYSGSTLSTVIADLQTLVTGLGITLSVESGYGGRSVSIRFDGASVWEALQSLAGALGLHLSVLGATVTIGGFGVQLEDAYYMNVDSMNMADPQTLANQPRLVVIESISKEDNVEDMCNWILPIGAGTNQQALKLKNSTRTSPYTIQTATGPNGKPYWYLSDAASIATYGEIRRVVQWPDIVATSNTAADKVNAANQLYDAANAYISRMKDPTTQYTMSLRYSAGNVFGIPAIGYKIRVVYRGNVFDKYGADVDYISIDAYFWVLGVTRRYGLEGVTMDVEIGTSDIVPESTAGKIVSSIQQNNTRGRTVSVVPVVNRHYYHYTYSNTLTATARLEITSATLDVERVRVRMIYGGLRQNLTTGVTDSATTPTGMRFYINSVDVTTVYGGAWTGSGQVVMDITDYIVNAAGGLYQVHLLQVNCASGNGRVEFYIEVLETVSGVET